MGHDKKRFFAGLVLGMAGGMVVGASVARGSKAAWRKYKLDLVIAGLESEIFERLIKTKQITEDAYADLVDEVVDSYAALRDFSEDKAARIADSFKARFREMRKMAKESARRAKEELDEDEG